MRDKAIIVTFLFLRHFYTISRTAAATPYRRTPPPVKVSEGSPFSPQGHIQGEETADCAMPAAPPPATVNRSHPAAATTGVTGLVRGQAWHRG